MTKIILFFVLFPVLVSAQKNYSVQLEDYMKRQIDVNEFSGNVLVAKNGQVIYQKTFGFANKELMVRNNIGTKFQIGSLTKQFTAACILQLAEAGKLKLTDTIGSYFRGFSKADIVTVHMLLNHTSGIRSYTELPEFWRIASIPLEKDSMIALIKRQPFDFSPGTKYHYSNSGYYLLGCIIEKVSGQSYGNYLLNSVIKKAGLKNTFVNRWDSILSNRASGYMKNDNEWQNAPYVSMEGAYSGGAIISTVEDLFKWNSALFENKVISAASLTKMTTPYLQHYGYGLRIDSFQHHLWIGHGGKIPGFSSYMVRFPTDNTIVVVLSNSRGNASGIAYSLAATLFGIPVIPPSKHKEVKIDSMSLDRYTGKYALANADTLQIVEKNGKLYSQISDSETELKPESGIKFFYADESDRQIEFTLDKSRKVTDAFLINGGIKERMKRL